MITVYRFGTPAGVDVSAVDEQLRLAHELRNHLVELQLAYEASLRQVWSAYPAVAEVEAAVAEADQRVEELSASAATERSAAGRKGPTTSSAMLREAKSTLRALRQRRRDLIAEVKPTAAPALEAATSELKAATKASYAEYSQARGLYWATYNAVLDHHRVAVGRVKALRASGRAAQLRFRRWDGSGTLAVQLQSPRGPRTPADVADPEGRWRNVLVLPWVAPDQFAALSRGEQRRAGRGVLRWCYGQGRVVDVPVVVHRMLPPDADITGAQLVVTRRGGHRRVEVHVTARVPDPPQASGPAVAVHLGWRCDEGEVRVATWRASAPVEVPASLRDVVRPLTASTGTVVLPSRLVARGEAHDHLRGQRDVALDKIRSSLVGWLGEHPQDDLTAAEVARWRSPRRFAALAWRWHASPPGDVAVELMAWRHADRAMWESEVHGRAGVVDARDDAYRRAAAWLTSVAGRVVLDDTVIAEVARRPDPAAEQEVPTHVAQRAATQRTLAAPGRLRELVRQGAMVRGVAVVVVVHTGITRTHYRCGHVNPADGRYAASRVVPCDGCGQSYDQDGSATLAMLAASGEMPTHGSVGARDTG